MKNIFNFIVAVAAVFGGLLASCIDDHEVSCPADQKVPDSELMLTVRFDMGPSTKVGDPGSDHRENVAGWKNVGIYLVYETGHVLPFVFDTVTFKTPKIYNVFSGKADVFVVALPEGQQLPEYASADQIRNMKTLDLSDENSGLDKQHYMRNIFSGSASIDIVPEGNTSVNVVCKRLVAKVDVQYDVQPGIVENKFTEAAMSDISFNGVSQAYIFPDRKTEGDLSASGKLVELTSVDGTISERNGRIYSYMFPGAASLGFTVDYTGTGEQITGSIAYTATFNSPLAANVWYKVNFTVKGTSASDPDNVTIQNTGSANQQ